MAKLISRKATTQIQQAVAGTHPIRQQNIRNVAPSWIGYARAQVTNGIASTILAMSTCTRLVTLDMECLTELVVRHFLNMLVVRAVLRLTPNVIIVIFFLPIITLYNILTSTRQNTNANPFHYGISSSYRKLTIRMIYSGQSRSNITTAICNTIASMIFALKRLNIAFSRAFLPPFFSLCFKIFENC